MAAAQFSFRAFQMRTSTAAPAARKGGLRPRRPFEFGPGALPFFAWFVAGLLGLSAVAALPEERTRPAETAGADGSRTSLPVKKASGDEPLSLLVDYLPVALYVKEPLTACFRLENSGAKALKIRLAAQSQDGQGHTLATQAESLEIPAGGAGNYQKDHDLEGVRRIGFELKLDGRELKGPAVRMVGEGDPWPRSEVREGRLVEVQTGEILVLIVARRKKDEQRTWSPLRWVLGRDEQQDDGQAGPLKIFLPGAWAVQATPAGNRAGTSAEAQAAKEEGGLDFEQLAALGQGKSGPPVALGPYPFDGAAPIMKALADGLGRGGAPGLQRVILCLPPEDLEVGTDPRVYQIALEAWLIRLAQAGVRQVLVLPPFKYGIPKRRQELLWRATEAAGRVTGARIEEVSGLLEERYWRVEPAQKGVYGRRPNAEGRQALAKLLQERMR